MTGLLYLTKRVKCLQGRLGCEIDEQTEYDLYFYFYFYFFNYLFAFKWICYEW